MHFLEYLKNGKNGFSLARKTFSISSNEVFLLKIGFRIISTTISTCKSILLILKNTISSKQKRILQLVFLLVETNTEIRKNQIFKK